MPDRCTAALAALLLLLPIGAAAQEAARPAAPALEAAEDDPLVTDRPDATESAATVRPGRVQLEAGYTLAGVGEDRAHSLGEVLLRIGVADRLEVRVGLNSFAWLRAPGGNASGFSDTSIGLKYKLREGGHSAGDPAIALLVATSLPTGADEFGSELAEPSARLAAAWGLSDRVALTANVGWALLHDAASGERLSELAASVSVGYGLDDRWGVFLEYFGFYPAGGNEPAANLVDGGLTYLLGPNLQLDGRVGFGVDGGADDFFVGVGTSVRW